MNNIEKAEKAHKLYTRIQKHSTNIEELKKRLKYNQEGEKAAVHLYCYLNSPSVIEIDEDTIANLILSEHYNLEKSEKELDDLLNGDVNKLKECLEGLKGGEQNSRK